MNEVTAGGGGVVVVVVVVILEWMFYGSQSRHD